VNIVWLAKQKLSFCMVDCSFGSNMVGGGGRGGGVWRKM